MPPLTAIDSSWRPGDAVYQLLAQHNIPRAFAEDQLPEFILYWSERGQKNHSWGSKFAKHVIHEWRLDEIKRAKQGRVISITHEWRPSKKAVQHLLDVGIAQTFINECIVSFVMYWCERGDEGSTWNSKFVEHVKYRDRQAQAAANLHNNGQRMPSLQDELNDRSWVTAPNMYSINKE